ncbi:hypothetical protein AMAG_09278 [Allomyces macrogynus ATCC 38327]|uniref:C-CAP/cofactor C-like domain-containing protein n=1 Tax=Allomyces macrogynus (strain ATCC 38327) TaxID=578462 RepID=A0A0L0SNZ5_ALLM3|nr:hypothetical protein AMAG_09278 [Allomyces macrogynus ATCC 38327]|eukprot:KNE64241.1 hypothetical protein AMAG_09278 [Allomyces macrogynus ATCC 38327]
MSATDLAQEFSTAFTAFQERAVGDLAAADSHDAAALDAVHRACVAMDQKVTEAAQLYLPPYDLAKYQATIKTLIAQVESKRAAARATKKFTFKSRKKLGHHGAKHVAAAAAPAPAPVAAPAPVNNYSADTTDVVADVADTHRVHVTQADMPRDVAISDIARSVVVIGAAGRQRVGAVHLSRVVNSVIAVVAPVDGSLLVEGLRDSVLIVAGCRQLRVHEAHNARLVAYTVSDPIIEDSDGVVAVASVPAADELGALVPGVENITAHDNHVHGIKDFHWLASDRPSPHWHSLQDDDETAMRVQAAVANVARALYGGEEVATELDEAVIDELRACLPPAQE